MKPNKIYNYGMLNDEKYHYNEMIDSHRMLEKLAYTIRI